uniref:Major facilitator superfamily (MFS) profile domain-containing protein n=1 Tax=Oryza brachyantha TaxID=4533 RepID=J3M0Z6_ORYBR
MDAAERTGGLRTPILADEEASCSNWGLVSQETSVQKVHKVESCSDKALLIILTRDLSVIALTLFTDSYNFYADTLSWIISYESHQSRNFLSASNVATVSSWAGASYLMPIIGAAVADSCWGKYTTAMAGFSVALVGMAIVTASATLPSLRPPPRGRSTYCVPATLSQALVFFTGIYLCAVGIGCAKAVLISFAKEQFDDGGKNARERESKASYFSWYYAVANLAMLTAGTLLVWVEDKVSWGFGYGLCASLVAVAIVVLAVTAPIYRILPPVGSPLKGTFQVLVASSRKAKLTAPDDATELFEDDGAKNSSLHPVYERLEHTDEFRCLDKAAIVTDEDLEDGDPWRLCTVTQVEEVKILLRLIPIWLTSAVYFVANTQAQTTFVQQGTKTDNSIARGAVSVPAASLSSIEMAFVAVSVTLYNRAVLEFFYDQSPETMRGASTAFYFLSISIGNLLNSQLVTLVAKVTAAGGSVGWFPADLDDGHLDLFFLLVVAITAVNFAVYIALAKNYTPKKIKSKFDQRRQG